MEGGGKRFSLWPCLIFEAFPNFLQAHRSLAKAHANLGHLNEALEHATKAIALGGADARLYGLLAYVNYQKENHASSLLAYRMARMFDPKNPQYLKGELFSLASSGQHRDVLAKLKEMMPSEPSNSQYWILKAHCYLSHLQGPSFNISILYRYL